MIQGWLVAMALLGVGLIVYACLVAGEDDDE